MAVQIGVPADAANSSQSGNTQYAFNVCGQLFIELTTVSIDADFQGQGAQTLTANISAQSLAGVLAALNTLGVGQFVTEVIAGKTNIVTYSNVYVFSNLNINDNSTSTTINFDWDFTFNTPVGIYSIQVVNITQGIPILLQPNQPSGSVQNAAGVTKGDTVDFSFIAISAGPFNGTVSIYKNGCLQETTPFTGAGGGSGPVLTITYDRDPDVYTFVVVVD